MALAPTLAKYLATKNVAYDVLAHEPTQGALRTAQVCHIRPVSCHRAVVLV